MYQQRDFIYSSPDVPNGRTGAGLAELYLTLVKGLPEVRSICDLGCGNGYLAGRLAELGYNVTGVDASASGISAARRHYPKAKFVCALLDERLPAQVKDAGFDLVISSDVIEHLYRPADLLEAAAALIRPRGHLLLGTPYHGYWKNLVLSAAGRMDTHYTSLCDGGHIKFFSVKTLSALVTQHGFRELRFAFYGRAPYLWKNMICHARGVRGADRA